MTITEAQKYQGNLEDAIAQLIERFEFETQTKVTQITVRGVSPTYTYGNCKRVQVEVQIFAPVALKEAA